MSENYKCQCGHAKRPDVTKCLNCIALEDSEVPGGCMVVVFILVIGLFAWLARFAK